MQGQDLRGMLADSMLKGYNMPMQPSGQPSAMDSRRMLAKGMQSMDPRQGLLYRGASAGADKLQQAILALMELIQSGQKSFEKGYKSGMRLR